MKQKTPHLIPWKCLQKLSAIRNQLSQPRLRRAFISHSRYTILKPPRLQLGRTNPMQRLLLQRRLAIIDVDMKFDVTMCGQMTTT